MGSCDMYGYLITKNTFSLGVSLLFRWFVPSAVRCHTALLLLCFLRMLGIHTSRISTPPSLLIFIRVKSCMDCLFDPACVVRKITINKLNFVPEWLMSGVVALKRRSSGYRLVGFLDHAPKLNPAWVFLSRWCRLYRSHRESCKLRRLV